jgi:fatty acid amide hydrolase 2
LNRTPGGSSGGESALLGAGASLLSLSSDIAGSCRLPAMFVGVYSHKPTPFVCSPNGHNPTSDDPVWGNFFTTAPMVRYAEDLPLLLEAMRDKDGPKVELFKEINVSAIRFHYMTHDYSGLTESISPCIAKSLLKVANHFNAKEVKLPLMKWTLDISMLSMLLMNFDSIYSKHEEGRKPKTAVKETCKYFIGQSESTLPSVSINTLKFAMRQVPQRRQNQLNNIKKKLKEEILSLLGDNGVLFYPTFPSSANKHYEVYYRLFDPCYMMIFNTLGLPVTQVHTGFDKENLPIGIQVVGTPGNDHLSIAVAREMQKVFGGWKPAEEVGVVKT